MSPNASIWLDRLRSNDVTSAPPTTGSWYIGHWDRRPCSRTWNIPLYTHRQTDVNEHVSVTTKHTALMAGCPTIFLLHRFQTYVSSQKGQKCSHHPSQHAINLDVHQSSSVDLHLMTDSISIIFMFNTSKPSQSTLLLTKLTAFNPHHSLITAFFIHSFPVNPHIHLIILISVLPQAYKHHLFLNTVIDHQHHWLLSQFLNKHLN